MSFLYAGFYWGTIAYIVPKLMQKQDRNQIF